MGQIAPSKALDAASAALPFPKLNYMGNKQPMWDIIADKNRP